jgi:hypothetical protein
MPRKENPKAGSDSNLLLAVLALTCCSILTALVCSYICTYVLDSFESTEACALLITANGIRSDSATLEQNVNTAVLGLQSCRDFGLALGIGNLGVLVALWLRLRLKGQKAS